MRIAHVIPSLGAGGAQTMLAKLLEAGAGGDEQLVVVLRPGGGVWPRIAATGVDLCDLGLRAGQLSPLALLRLTGKLGRWKPDLVHGWMYHGNLAATLATRLLGRGLPVLWNIRHSVHDLAVEKPATRAVIRIGAPLSGTVSAIVYNSTLSARQHEALGYAHAHAEVIPNGFDTAVFHPDPPARARWRDRLGVAPAALVIGIVARHHPMKDHESLIRAAGQLLSEGLELFLVMVGERVGPENRELGAALKAAGLQRRAALLGERTDIPEIVAALDLAVLCSAWGEGFPNALGEAMACGVPCVATDVGDCRPLLKEGGVVVPPRDPQALAAALGRLMRLEPARRQEIGAVGRARIEREFTLPVIADRYNRLYERLVPVMRPVPSRAPA